MPSKKPFSTFFLTLTPELSSSFKRGMRGYPTRIETERLTLEKLDPKTEILGVFVDSKITKDVFKALPNVKLIVTLSTGFDHIDLKEAKRRKVTVCNVPTYGETTVAEHALTLLLALAKNLFESTKRVKEGAFDFHGLRGFDVEGKTIGIIGTGKIGTRFAELLQGFRVRILAYDPFPKKELEKKLGLTYVTKHKLFAESDIISLHTLLLPETVHMINKATIAKMKRGVYLINTSRGGLVDSGALLAGLQSGKIAGAGLDVLDQENLLEDPLLLCDGTCGIKETKTTLMNTMIIDHPKTIITPHTAFNTKEAVERILSVTIENIHAFGKGKPQNLVTL